MYPAQISHIASYRLEPPVLLPAHVRRTSLIALALRTPQPRVLLVRSPAGFGKTTLLGQIAQQIGLAGSTVAWLTLEGTDNDAARFVACLASATASLLHTTIGFEGRATDDVALAMLDGLAKCTDPFVLVLDEFEHITDASVLGLVRALIDRLPAQAHLLIGARSIPDLGLDGLRARGRMVEFDANALRFSLDETTEFLSRKRSIPAADIAALHECAEGWPVALWLAAAAMDRHTKGRDVAASFWGLNALGPNVSGMHTSDSQTQLARYLADDVLGRLDPSMQHFLLRTSLLRTLNAEVCDAVLGRMDSAGQLDAINAANLFLGAREDTPGEFRYHGLFASFLRERLSSLAPSEVPLLHAAASRWYESKSRIVAAIEHAVAGGDTHRSIGLLSQHAGGFIAEGRGRLLGRWFDLLPPCALGDQPLLQLLRAWATMYERGAARVALEPSASPAGLCLDSGMDNAIRNGWATLNSILMALTDRYEMALEIGREPLNHLPSGLDFGDVALINNLSLALLCLGRKAEARSMVDASRGHLGDGRSGFNAAVCEAVEAMIDMQEARLREATARLKLATRMMQPKGGRSPPSRSFIGVPLAEALYESGDLESARKLLLVLLPLTCNSSMVDHLISTHILLARIEFIGGDVDRAFELLNQLEMLGYERHLPRLTANARLERSRVYLLQHHHDAAHIELIRCSTDAVWQLAATDTSLAQDMEYPAIGEFRLALAIDNGLRSTEELNIVLSSIRSELARATVAQRTRRAMKLRLFQALMHFKLGESSAAHAGMEQLLRVASAEGFVRLLLDEGPDVVALCRSLEMCTAEEKREPIFAEHLHRLCGTFDNETIDLHNENSPARFSEFDEAVVDADAQVQGRSDALTVRELRLLAAVADGYSNGSIAEKFFISIHTVRGHLRSINTKLQVASRTQAVAAARSKGFLS